MSGGVDSSVAAVLLKEQGHDITGVMMSLWCDPESGENACCTPESMALARNIARQWDFPFYVVDAEWDFRERVVQLFIDCYKQGWTPNPCVACNQRLRWNTLLKKADELGATHIATGHYARLRDDGQGTVQLLRGIDETKDQSYVLHGLTQAQLARTIFPLGERTKQEIRELARQHHLASAERPDSQDLCFVGNGDYRQFLVRNAPEVVNPGPIVNLQGEVLGQHQGLAFYTIGQRKGLRIAAPQPYYVLEKDVLHNRLIVGTAEELGRDELVAAAVNWIAGQPPDHPLRAQVKNRYKAKAVWATITPLEDNTAHVQFEQPVRDITPGQAAVFYDGDICLGGGIIQ